MRADYSVYKLLKLHSSHLPFLPQLLEVLVPSCTSTEIIYNQPTLVTRGRALQPPGDPICQDAKSCRPGAFSCQNNFANNANRTAVIRYRPNYSRQVRWLGFGAVTHISDNKTGNIERKFIWPPRWPIRGCVMVCKWESDNFIEDKGEPVGSEYSLSATGWLINQWELVAHV